MPQPSAWSVPDLRRRCRELREGLPVASEGAVTAEEIANYWPGGSENTLEKLGSKRGQWIWCYASLVRLCDRMREVPVDTTQAELARIDASVDRPLAVDLRSGETVHVYPKGYVASEYLTWLDREVQRTVQVAASLMSTNTPEADRVLALAPLLRGRAVQLWAWILTHPPACLPFNPYGNEEPEPPAWTETMMGEDLLALYAAHRQVNGQRNVLIAQLFPDEPKASVKLSLAGFIGAYAHEKGSDVGHYMDHFAIGKLFAQAVGAAQQHEAAMQRAKPPAEAA